VHQLPKMWQALKQLMSLQVKKSVYLILLNLKFI